MRNLTKQRQRERRQADPLRDVFRDQFPLCWICLRPATDIHEMTPGAARRRGYGERCTWIATCRACHQEKLQPFYAPFDLAGQLALKSRFDLGYYDREHVLDIKDLAPTAITEKEVLAAVWNLLQVGTAR